MAQAAVTASGEPPMPNRMSMPLYRLVVAIAAEMSPSPMRAMRAPASRTCCM